MQERAVRYRKRRKAVRRRRLLGVALVLSVAFGLTGLLPKPATDAVPKNRQRVLAVKEQQEQEADNLILVNGQNPIPERYTVELVELENGEQVSRNIYGPLTEMLEAARGSNWNLLPQVVSGYRTQEMQQQIYEGKIQQFCQDGYTREEAEQLAGQWVALPGHSEHQLGLAVDINGATNGLYQWLQENSYRYGFIFRYPGNKTSQTGVAEEVWHYRYVGVEAATKMYQQGICLEEYVERYSGL